MSSTYLIVAGWGFGPQALAPLADALRTPDVDVEATSICALTDSHGSAELHTRLTGHDTVLVVWSMAALVALEGLCETPDTMPRKIVLLSPTARFCATEGYTFGAPARALRAQQRALSRDPDTALTAFIDAVFAPHSISGAERAALLSDAKTLAPASLETGLQYLGNTDLRERLSASSSSHLHVIHGEADAIIPPAAGREVAERCGASFELLPGQGHGFPIHAATETAERIRAIVNAGDWA